MDATPLEFSSAAELLISATTTLMSVWFRSIPSNVPSGSDRNDCASAGFASS